MNKKEIKWIIKGEVIKMKDLDLFFAYEFVSGFIPFLIVLAVFTYSRKKKGLSISKISCVMLVIFSIYIINVYHLTSVGTIYNVLTYKLEIRKDLINLIPFSNDIYFIGYLLNVVLFIPLGILAPLIFKKMDKLKYIFGAGLGFSMFIELSQLLNNRSTDIDDLILNTVGAIIGFALYKIFDKCTNSKYDLNDKIPMVIMIISILVMFIGRFLFFNQMGLARLLYGF